MTILDQALASSKKSLEFEFDDKLYAIRRNLMITSSVVIGSTFLSPPENGLYEVNIGVLKGSVERPEFISYFLALVCVYYLLWFYVYCRKVAVNNYQTVKSQFMSHLAEHRAHYLYRTLYDYRKKNIPPSSPFKVLRGTEVGWIVGFGFMEREKNQYAAGIPQLNEAGFDIKKFSDQPKVTYEYEPVLEDYKYLHFHLDLYWRGRVSYLFTTGLPIAYSTLAIVLLSFHIYNQLTRVSI